METNPNSKIPLLVRAIEQVDAHTLGVQWTDGHVSRFRIAQLRRHCPCAMCVDEWTGELRLDHKSIPDDLKAIKIDSVGRYAMNIHFADGHNTGIYPFTLLRTLCECPQCKKA